MITIGDATPAHAAGVQALLRQAFDGEAEAQLVGELIAAGDVVTALVAEDAMGNSLGLAGYVLFCRLKAELGGEDVPAVALAPLAVRADRRNQGIGERLVGAGLARGREAGQCLAVVLGDPAYYRRFGFSAAAARGLASPFSGPHLQALELQPGVLASGRITYPKPFDRFVE